MGTPTYTEADWVTSARPGRSDAGIRKRRPPRRNPARGTLHGAPSSPRHLRGRCQISPVVCGGPLPEGVPADYRVAGAELADVGVEPGAGEPPEERGHGRERPGDRLRVRNRAVQNPGQDAGRFRAGHLVGGQFDATAGEVAGPLD